MAEGIRSLVGRRMTKSIKFVNEDVKISKLSVAEVIEIQDLAKTVNESSDTKSGLELIKKVIRLSVEGASELTDTDFETFPMDELSKLSNEIMRFSGISGDSGK